MASHTRFVGRLPVLACAVLALLALAACDSGLDREFGPSSLHGEGALPGRAFTTSAPTGL